MTDLDFSVKVDRLEVFSSLSQFQIDGDILLFDDNDIHLLL